MSTVGDHARVGHTSATIDSVATHIRRLFCKRRIAVRISHHNIPPPLGELLSCHDLLVDLLLVGAICTTIRCNKLPNGADLLTCDCYVIDIILYITSQFYISKLFLFLLFFLAFALRGVG